MVLQEAKVARGHWGVLLSSSERLLRSLGPGIAAAPPAVGRSAARRLRIVALWYVIWTCFLPAIGAAAWALTAFGGSGWRVIGSLAIPAMAVLIGVLVQGKLLDGILRVRARDHSR